MEQTEIKLKEINMLNDALFKALFRSDEAIEMVSSFLSEITGIDKELLRKADYQGGEIPKKKLSEKNKTSDIIVKIENNNLIILEMNQYQADYIFEKNTSYAFSIAAEGVLSGTKNYPTVILVNFDNFNKFKTKESILNFKLRDEYGNIETNQYHSIHLILDNIVNGDYNISKETKKLIKLLKQKTIFDMKREFEGDDTYMACIRKVEDLSADPNFIGYYDYEEAIEQDKWAFKQTGIREGREEKNIEIIKNMLKENMDLSLISKITGTTLEEIKKLID